MSERRRFRFPGRMMPCKTLALKKGSYPVIVKYFQEGGTNMLKVSWKGPGIEKQEIPGSVLFHKYFIKKASI